MGYAIRMQFLDFRRHDHATATAEDFDVLTAPFLEQVDHVFEKLDMPPLVRRDGDALNILLHGGGDDFIDRTIMAKMDHLNPGRLQDAPHDVDRGIVTIEQGCRGDEAYFVLRLIGREFGDNAKISHGGTPI